MESFPTCKALVLKVTATQNDTGECATVAPCQQMINDLLFASTYSEQFPKTMDKLKELQTSTPIRLYDPKTQEMTMEYKQMATQACSTIFTDPGKLNKCLVSAGVKDDPSAFSYDSTKTRDMCAKQIGLQKADIEAAKLF